MQLAIIILAYSWPAQLRQLVEALKHPCVSTYIHVDARVQIRPFRAALSGLDVTMLPRRASVWGSAECVDAELDGLRLGVRDGCDYFALISGQDFPLRPAQELVTFFEAVGATSYLEYRPIADSVHRFGGRDRTDFYAYTVRGKRELCIPRGEDTSFLGLKGRLLNEGLRLRDAHRSRSFPGCARPFMGSTWWNMSRPAAEYVLDFCADHPEYRAYHQHTWVPEEIFMQSILAGSGYQGSELVNDNLRFYRWDGMRAATLDESDVTVVMESGKLFARKFIDAPPRLIARSAGL